MNGAVVARRSVRHQLHMVLRQVYYEQLNFWLNPIAAIFTVGFAVVFLVLLGSSAGSSTSSVLAASASRSTARHAPNRSLAPSSGSSMSTVEPDVPSPR